MSRLSYRKDNRDQKTFEADIKEGASIERKLIKLYIDDLNERKGGGYSYIDNGCDNSGEFLEDCKVTTDADFIIIKGKTKYKGEIKFSRPNVNAFHIKEHQLKSYIKQNCCIIMFNAVDDDENIAYTIMYPKDFQGYIDNGEKKRFWGKDCIRFKTGNFQWHKVKKSF